MKEIKLPPHPDGTAETIAPHGHPIVIIGANGAGKSRFTSRLTAEMGEKAFSLSALNALYACRKSDSASIDRLFDRAASSMGGHPTFETELERLFALLMHDEMVNLIDYKMKLANDPKASLGHTRLDTVVKIWRSIFPDNNILFESGKMLFSRGVDPESYGALKLSDGERAALYYIGGAVYAPKGAAIFIDSPEMFLHPSVMQMLWNSLEQLRRDCTWIYTTHDLEFASSRSGATTVWVRDFDASTLTWDYDILPQQSGMPDEMYMAIIGGRKPVLFIEGDGIHSIDAKLYPLIFKEYTVKSLGSCNKVIEATRTFNDLAAFHHMDSHGIVDRDRRDAREVDYLRSRKVMVPEVAEIENILMLEEVIRAVAASCGKDENRVFEKVKHSVMSQFRHDLRQQALLHTRHRVKRTMEYRIDGRFANINMLEEHMASLVNEINPRALYEGFCRDFRRYLERDDYASVLRVYNQKSMLPGSNVATLCGLHNKEEYVAQVINLLRGEGEEAARIRRAVKKCFGIAL